MRMKQSVLEFGNSIVRFFHIKSLFRPLYYKFFKSKQIEEQRVLFVNHAHDALRCFDECMRQANIHYSLAFGTMLGAVREHGFIRHDIDIDTMMWFDEYSESLPSLLEKRGFRQIHSFLVDGGKLGREDTYEYMGVQIDIFYIYPPVMQLPYCCDFLQRDCLTFDACISKYGSLLPRRIELPFNREIKYTQFENMVLPVPSNAEEILAYRYGPDYMTPNPNWGVQSYNEHIIEWPEKAGILINYI